MGIRCIICNSSEQEVKEKINSPINGNVYTLYHCLDCDAEWWYPPEMDKSVYENELVEEYHLLHLGAKQELAVHHKFFIKSNRINSSDFVLDIGCGDGLFMSHLTRYTKNVYGVDFDEKSLDVAKSKYGLKNLFAMSLDEFKDVCVKQKIKFNYITFFEVLEHQDNPRRFMQMVMDILQEGGKIAGSVPNRQRLFASFRRRFVDRDDFPPNHFLWLNKKSLYNFLIDMGFKNVRVIELREPVIYGSYYFVETLYFPFLIKNFIKKNILGIKESVPVSSQLFESVSMRKRVITTIIKIVKFLSLAPFIPFSLLVKRHLYFEATK